MNDARRKELERARVLIAEARDILDTAATEERDYYDNMPENMQGGDKGTKADEVADTLEEVTSDIDEMLGKIEECES